MENGYWNSCIHVWMVLLHMYLQMKSETQVMLEVSTSVLLHWWTGDWKVIWIVMITAAATLKGCQFGTKHRPRRHRVWGHVPPKIRYLAPIIRERIFFGHLSCKIWTFSGKYHVKLENCVNFSGKYHVKFGYFVNLHILRQKCLASKVDRAPTPMAPSQTPE